MSGALLMAATSALLTVAAAATGEVSITNQTVSSVGNGTTTVSGTYKLQNDGTVRSTPGGTLETWLVSGAVGDFECRVVEQTGALSSGTLGTWQSLSTTRSWSVSCAAGTSASCTFSVSIRDAATQTVLDTAVVTINVTNTASSSGTIDWTDITAAGTGALTGTNSNQTMTSAGTLNFSTTFGGTYKVFKNGADQGQVASLVVANGDTVHFSATDTPDAGAISSGTFTVSGLVSDSFNIRLRNTSTV